MTIDGRSAPELADRFRPSDDLIQTACEMLPRQGVRHEIRLNYAVREARRWQPARRGFRGPRAPAPPRFPPRPPSVTRMPLQPTILWTSRRRSPVAKRQDPPVQERDIQTSSPGSASAALRRIRASTSESQRYSKQHLGYVTGGMTSTIPVKPEIGQPTALSELIDRQLRSQSPTKRPAECSLPMNPARAGLGFEAPQKQPTRVRGSNTDYPHTSGSAVRPSCERAPERRARSAGSNPFGKHKYESLPRVIRGKHEPATPPLHRPPARRRGQSAAQVVFPVRRRACNFGREISRRNHGSWKLATHGKHRG